MKIEEQAAFFEEISNQGILIYESPIPTSGQAWIARKYATPANPMLAFLSGESLAIFEEKEKAIQYIKDEIGWNWKSTKTDEPEVQMTRFAASLMFDVGIGPQIAELGQVSHACDNANWMEEVYASAEGLAQDYVIKEMPDRLWGTLKKQVKILPIVGK